MPCKQCAWVHDYCFQVKNKQVTAWFNSWIENDMKNYTEANGGMVALHHLVSANKVKRCNYRHLLNCHALYVRTKMSNLFKINSSVLCVKTIIWFQVWCSGGLWINPNHVGFIQHCVWEQLPARTNSWHRREVSSVATTCKHHTKKPVAAINRSETINTSEWSSTATWAAVICDKICSLKKAPSVQSIQHCICPGHL